MTLVDTSVWINHLRCRSSILSGLLEEERVLVHPSVLGELACGNLSDRNRFLSLLRALPAAPRMDDEEVLFFLDRNRLMGRGLGWVDIHLLGSAVLAGATLWSVDGALRDTAARIGVEFRGL